MALYPSLEDMKVDQMIREQNKMGQFLIENSKKYSPNVSESSQIQNSTVLYPALGDYMGLELTDAMIIANMPEYKEIALNSQSDLSSTFTGLIAPVSDKVALQRAQITNGIREVYILKYSSL